MRLLALRISGGHGPWPTFFSGPRDPRDRRSDLATIMTECPVIPKLSIQIEKFRLSTTTDTDAQERAATAGGAQGHDECPYCNPMAGADGSAARVRWSANAGAWIDRRSQARPHCQNLDADECELRAIVGADQ